MRVVRKSWKASLVLAILFFGAPGASSSICMVPAPITVMHGPGNSLSSTVQSPDQNEWSGWVTMTVDVDGQSYTFSYPVNAPAGGGIRLYRLFFSGTVTVFNYVACLDPDGMTESPEPVAIAEAQI